MYYRQPYPNELYHHGILGQKWGVRKYQNADGSLTAAGKKRLDRDIKENNSKKKDNRIKIDGPDAKRWVKEDISRTKKTVDASSNLTKEINNLERNTRPKTSKKPMGLSSMSDKELRDAINRKCLERQYNDLFSPENVSKGRKYVQRTLDYTTSALTIGSSALSIALAIKELRG